MTPLALKARSAGGALPAAMSRVRLFGSPWRNGWLVIGLFTATVSSVLVLAAFCMDVLSAARAYVGGESLWSKAQKDSVRYLMRYAGAHEQDDWQRYLRAISVPLGDRVAREQLETPKPDLDVVRRGFLAGGNHRDDIPGMIRLFRSFRHVPFLDQAIGIWTEGDRLVAELNGVADELHARVAADAGAATMQPLLARIEGIDRRLTPLEVRFSDTLGQASRDAQALLTIVVTTMGALLILFAAVFVRGVARQVARYQQSLRDANEWLEERVQDRTHQLTQLNARLVQLDRLKSEFLATMTHELRTPLNSILGFSGLLRDGRSGPLNEEQQRQIGLVHSSGQHLLQLIDDVLDLSHIEGGRMGLQLVSFDFTDLLRQIDASMRPIAQAKRLAFVYDARPAELPVLGDRGKCFRVLRCLVDNAVKFTERGEIRISAGFDGDDLLVTVSDSGIGIPAERLPVIFEAFRQGDGSFRRPYGGVGLGLYLSRKLLLMMGGTIGVESTPGAGTRVNVRMPQQPRQ